MIANDFGYARPDSVDEALALLATPGSRILAGGQHLVPLLAERFIDATLLIDISRIQSLRDISVTPAWLSIGGAATLTSLLSVEVAISAPLLHAVLPSVASRAVRNRSTIGGNIVVAHPNSELPVALSALEAQIILRSASGERIVPMAEFMTGPRSTAIAGNEIVSEVRIPLATGVQTIGAFSEVAPRSNALPHASVAVSMQVDAGGIIRSVRIVAGGVENVPARCRAHETALVNEPIAHSVAVLATVGETGLIPSPDLIEAAYAYDVVPALMRRAVRAAVAQFKGDDDQDGRA